MHRPSMYKWVGNFSFFSILIFFVQVSFAQTPPSKIYVPASKPEIKEPAWAEYTAQFNKTLRSDRTNGLSYVISGGLALAGGIAGANVTGDPVEKGIYALFQTIGIASIGYGAYQWQIGDENRLLFLSLQNTEAMTDTQRIAFLQSYKNQRELRERKERYIKAITHGMIAALNFYNASQQKQEGVKNTLMFVGGANLLASLSYTF